MKKLDNPQRARRLIEDAISAFALDLKGITVLTEAASGAYVATPVIAAAAGAERVIAVSRDSEYGTFEEVKEYTAEFAESCGVAGGIEVVEAPARRHAQSAELVTNLGFVRPIDRLFVESLPAAAAVSLMWEPWEFREGNLDLGACRERGIPVLGTRETDPRLRIFRYVGVTALKLLLECGVEVFRSKILLIGSGVFGDETKTVLESNGCELLHLDPSKKWDNTDAAIKNFAKTADAVVLAEHREKFPLLGGAEGLPPEWFEGAGAVIIHISGNADYGEIEKRGLKRVPGKKPAPGCMAAATDYAGPKPVVDLHTAGLKVGEALVRGMRAHGDTAKAVEFALKNSPAMDFGPPTGK